MQAIASISMMLESTLGAFYSSFRAILGVADQFNRLRGQLHTILTSLAALRWLKYMLHRLLVLLRLRAPGTEYSELAWHEAGQQNGALPMEQRKRQVTRSASLVFFALALGGPYIIWRLIQRIVKNVEGE